MAQSKHILNTINTSFYSYKRYLTSASLTCQTNFLRSAHTFFGRLSLATKETLLNFYRLINLASHNNWELTP